LRCEAAVSIFTGPDTTNAKSEQRADSVAAGATSASTPTTSSAQQSNWLDVAWGDPQADAYAENARGMNVPERDPGSL